MDASDGSDKIDRFLALKQEGLLTQAHHLVTFGVVTAGNLAFSVEAFRPHNQGRSWVITDVAPKVMNAHAHVP